MCKYFAVSSNITVLLKWRDQHFSIAHKMCITERTLKLHLGMSRNWTQTQHHYFNQFSGDELHWNIYIRNFGHFFSFAPLRHSITVYVTDRWMGVVDENTTGMNKLNYDEGCMASISNYIVLNGCRRSKRPKKKFAEKNALVRNIKITSALSAECNGKKLPEEHKKDFSPDAIKSNRRFRAIMA